MMAQDLEKESKLHNKDGKQKSRINGLPGRPFTLSYFISSFRLFLI